MQELFCTEDSPFLSALVNLLTPKELASLSLCCRHCSRAVYSSLPSGGPMGNFVEAALGDAVPKFYILMGRMLVPQSERHPNWKLLPLLCHTRAAPFSYFIASLGCGVICNNPGLRNPSTQRNLIFCGHNDEENSTVIRDRPFLPAAVVSQVPIDGENIIHFDFNVAAVQLDLVDLVEESNGRQVRKELRNKCLFYAHRSELLKLF